MADVINLRLARKAKLRTEAARAAAENRAAPGRSKAETQRARLVAERQRALLDGAKRDEP
jgi:hypothetical protein